MTRRSKWQRLLGRLADVFSTTCGFGVVAEDNRVVMISVRKHDTERENWRVSSRNDIPRDAMPGIRTAMDTQEVPDLVRMAINGALAAIGKKVITNSDFFRTVEHNFAPEQSN